jgi:MFS family permease
MKINRIALSTIFFVNGFLYANWAARLPELQRFYQVSNALLGYLLLASATGALVAMPISGWLTTRVGSALMTRLAVFLYCVVVPTLSYSSNLWVAAFFFFLLGVTAGALDVSMNGQAVFVERSYAKPIMSSFHAIFSIGMALGAGSGGLFAQFHWSLISHLTFLEIIGLIVCIWATMHLIPDVPNKTATQSAGKSGFRLPTKAVLPLGIIALCTMMGEGAMADWSAIYMNKVVGKNEFYSALAFGSFGTAMTIGRVFGDFFTAKLGKFSTMLFSSLFAIVGLALAIGFVSVETTLIGFFRVGLGLANVVPIIYSTAGNTPGVEPSVGIAMATSIGYAGFFVGPPAIGFLADAFGLRIGLVFSLMLFVVMLFVILALKKRDSANVDA